MMHPRVEKQPFFKPITNTDNPSSQTRQKSFQNQPTFQVPRAKENESIQQNSQDTNNAERLPSLYAKLHQELDDIRKGKVQREIEIKQKEKNLHEASCTIDMLRKSILDLQLQNENLSVKLQEEIGNREEIFQRINSTREMCNLLKDHSSKIEDRLSTCETERTELKYKEKTHLKQFEELAKQFQNLQLSAEEYHNNLKDQLSVQMENKHELELEWNEKITTAECQLKELLSSCDDKDIEIRDIRSQLCKNEDKLYDTKTAYDYLERKLQASELTVNQHKERLGETTNELTITKEHLAQLESRIASLNELFRTSLPEESLGECEHGADCSDVDRLASYITNTLQLLSQKQDRIQRLDEQVETLQSSIEELKSSKDMLIMEKSELEVKISALEEEKGDLLVKIQIEGDRNQDLETKESRLTMDLVGSKEEIMNMEMTITTLRSEIQDVNMDKSTLEEKLTAAQQEIKSYMKKLEECQKCLETKCDEGLLLSEDLQSVTNILSDERKSHEETSSKLCTLQVQMSSTEKELSYIGADAEKLQTEIKELHDNEKMLSDSLESANRNISALEEKIKNLTEELEEKNKDNEGLRGEMEELDKNIHGEMESKTKETSALEDKIKSLKESVSAKTKQVKETEKEVRSLKNKLTSQTKHADSKDGEISNLQSALEEAEKEKSELLDQIECRRSEACAEKESANAAKKEAKEMKKLSVKSVKEKEETMKKCEVQIADMTGTLEKYQQENHKLVAQKDKEIESLRQKIQCVEQTENSSRTEIEQKLPDLYGEIEQQKRLLDTAEEERKVMEDRCQGYANRITELDVGISSKEEKIVELTDFIASQKKAVSTSTTQTDITKDKAKAVKENVPMVPQTPQRIKTGNLTVRPTTPKSGYVPTTPTPATPHARDKASYTPHRTPVIKHTVKTPQGTITLKKTPQRSILKHDCMDSAVKKRRVAFQSPKDSDSSDTDSSQLMEIEIDELENRFKGTKSTTPLLVRPSPKVSRDLEEIEKPTHRHGTIPLHRVPRGGPVLSNKGELKKSSSLQEQENQQFKKLFPNDHRANQIQEVAEKKKAQQQKSANVRKTPNKAPGKFFKNSPKDRPTKTKKSKGKEETSWFDLDSVFGFGPED